MIDSVDFRSERDRIHDAGEFMAAEEQAVVMEEEAVVMEGAAAATAAGAGAAGAAEGDDVGPFARVPAP